MSTSQDPFGQPLRSGAPLPQGPLPQRPLPRILFWVLIVALYLLGGLALFVRSWLDIGPAATGTPATTAVETVAATLVPPTNPVILVPSYTAAPSAAPPAASATPFPTLTPRRTLYPTLTPRP